MSLSYCSHKRDRTRHASAVRLSFLLFSAERFSPSKIAPPLKLSIAAETTSLPCCTCLPFMPMLIQSQLVVAAAFSIRFYFLVRLGRSSSLCPFSSLIRRSSRASVVVSSSAFFASSFCALLPGLSLYLLSIHIMFHYLTLF
jgi:hypothetical protein